LRCRPILPQVGEHLFRPSQQPDALALIWKFHARGGVAFIQHIKVVEQAKANSFSLGKRLVIGTGVHERTYEVSDRPVPAQCR
jgi:hypothetical protein